MRRAKSIKVNVKNCFGHMKARTLILLPLLTSVLLIFIFTKTSLGWLAYIALLPLLFFITLVKLKELPQNKAILSIWLCGLFFFIFNQIWMYFINPSSWASVQGSAATIAIIFSWLYASFIYSLGFLVFGLLVVKIKFKPLGRFALLIIPSAWVLGEYARSILFSVFLWGPQASIGAHWNFGNLGYAAITTPLSFVSRFIGLFGLSFLVVCINIAILRLFYKKYRFLVVIVVLIMVLALINTRSFISTKLPITVAIVQLKDNSTDYGPELVKKIQQKYSAPVPKILILPEESQFYYLPDNIRSSVTNAVFHGKNGHVITSAFENTSRQLKSPVIQYHDSNERLLSSQRKNFLIPVGEYLPKSVEAVMTITGNANEIENYKKLRIHLRGTKPEQPVLLDNVLVGALACSGVLSPQQYQKMTKKGAEVLTNSAALDIFSGTNLFFEQTRPMVRFHAIANARPFVHSAMGGDSFAIDAQGKVLAYQHPRSLGYETATIVPSNKMTPYSRIGEVFPFISFLVIAVAWIMRKN